MYNLPLFVCLHHGSDIERSESADDDSGRASRSWCVVGDVSPADSRTMLRPRLAAHEAADVVYGCKTGMTAAVVYIACLRRALCSTVGDKVARDELVAV